MGTVNGVCMARPGGNPDFGTKYRSERRSDRPLSEQVKAQIPPQVKLQLQTLAQEKNCTVPDVIREAIDKYLAAQSMS